MEAVMIDHVYPMGTDWIEKPIKGFYQVIHAGNGEFIRAKRAGLHAIIQVSDDIEDGCLDVVAMVELEKKISAEFMHMVYQDFLEHLPDERLAWVTDTLMMFPAQVANGGMVKPKNPFDPFIENVLVDIHSHNVMDAYFSGQDNRDEGKGFRVYIVIGRVGSGRPQIRARVGIFGHFMDIPMETVAELPEGLNFEDLHESA
jgi:PRTRC genetic system protein A